MGNSNSTFNSGLNNGSIFSPNNMQSLNLNVSSALYPQQNSFSTYSQPYQLAQNSLPNSGSDVGNISSSNFSPEVLKERMFPVIRNMEKPLDYIYIDTTWNKTTGAGANVDDWDTAAEGEKVWNYVQQQEGVVEPRSQNKLGYGVFGALAIRNMINNKDKLANQPYTDKYKHALINCKAAQYGEGGYDLANAFSNFKEDRDISSGGNTLDSSFADNYANKIGRLLGTKYNQEKCETLVPRYIDQYYK